eukprot:1923980-Prymnesium_polylepis.1
MSLAPYRRWLLPSGRIYVDHVLTHATTQSMVDYAVLPLVLPNAFPLAVRHEVWLRLRPGSARRQLALFVLFACCLDFVDYVFLVTSIQRPLAAAYISLFGSARLSFGRVGFDHVQLLMKLQTIVRDYWTVMLLGLLSPAVDVPVASHIGRHSLI